MQEIVLDIETIPNSACFGAVDEAIQADIDALTAPGNYKDPAKIEAYLEEAKAKLLAEQDARRHKLGLSGGTGRIASIGWVAADCDDPAEEISLLEDTDADERNLLASFFHIFGGRGRGSILWIGHNIWWDLRFLAQRALILGVRIPSCWPVRFDCANRYQENVFDTLEAWAGADRASRTGSNDLDSICRALGIESPKAEGISGKDVWGLWQRGEIGKIAAYNRRDVEQEKKIYLRMRGAL